MSNPFRQWRWYVLGSGLLLIIVFSLWWLMQTPGFQGADPASQNPAEFLVADPGEDYAVVTRNHRLQFPEDHGAHPAFRQEWWYFTGNLTADNGREFGYQLTFFRFAHDANDALEKGGWNNEQTWMGHFAVTDIDGGEFFAEQDFARGGLGLADATSSPFAVWINGWSGHAQQHPECSDCFTLALQAAGERHGIHLQLDTGQAPVLHGDRGFSPKTRDESVASYYYSFPGLKTSGSIQIDGQAIAVRGLSWMDHEWSSAGLAKGQSGWDWFALHLDDGRKMMLYRVRQSAKNPVRYAVLIHSPQNTRPVPLKNTSFEETRYWRSPRSGNRYPVRWKITGTDLDLVVESAVADQELGLTFTYYEGAVKFSGTFQGQRVQGRGYMELTGYGP